LKAKQLFFSRDEVAKSIYYLQSGRARLTVVSKRGKEATITLLAVGDFIGVLSSTISSCVAIGKDSTVPIPLSGKGSIRIDLQ
jgi:CRP-like cAMP-binding protein